MASGTGLLDGHTCRWDPDALRLAGLEPAGLSPLVEWDSSLSGLRRPYAGRWPALKDVPWFLPLGDGALSNVGAGCTKSDWYCAMVGTSSALRVIVDHKDLAIPWGAWAYRLDRQRWVVGGALSEGGNVLAWIADALHLPDWQATEAAIARLPPDGHGLTVLPFWAGERSPNWRGDTRGAITGLSLATQPADIMRAAMEAISYQFAAVFETLQASSGAPKGGRGIRWAAASLTDLAADAGGCVEPERARLRGTRSLQPGRGLAGPPPPGPPPPALERITRVDRHVPAAGKGAPDLCEGDAAPASALSSAL